MSDDVYTEPGYYRACIFGSNAPLSAHDEMDGVFYLEACSPDGYNCIFEDGRQWWAHRHGIWIKSKV